MSALPQTLPSPPSRIREDLPREHGFEPLRVDGRIPPELRGTLYRNGPALMSLFDRPYAHLFEGDGGVTAVRFDQGQAYGAARVLESQALKDERRAGRPLYGFNARWMDRWPRAMRTGGKNAANTNVISWEGQLLALWEGGLPTAVDPETLATVGTTDLGQVIPAAFSAHPHQVGDTLFNFGVRYGRETLLDVFAWRKGAAPTRLATHTLPRATMLHDFIATDRHLVFFVSPIAIRIWRALMMIGSPTDLLSWQPEHGTEVIVIPLDTPETATRFTTEPFFQWHFSNAFEDGAEIVVDYVRYPDLSSFQDLESTLVSESGLLHRARIDPGRKTFRSEQIFDVRAEFPRIAPGTEGTSNRYIWLACDDERSGIARYDIHTQQAQTWWTEPGQFCAEPVFAARPGSTREEDGWALSLTYDARSHQSFVAVLDGTDPSRGPIARAWFDHHIPITFHGNFAPA